MTGRTPRRHVCLALPTNASGGAEEQASSPFVGWGTSLCWMGHALGNNSSCCAAVAELLFGEPMGFNIVRYCLGGASSEHSADFRAGGAVPCIKQGPDAPCDWRADAAQVAMLLAACGHGANTLEAFVNSPPSWLCKSGSSRGHKAPMRNNLARQDVELFAAFCADAVVHFQQAHGITFTSLSPFNEPASPAWCLAANNRQEGCYFSRKRAHQVLRACLRQPGLRGTQLVMPEQFCVHHTLTDCRRLPADLWADAVARVNTHTYTSRDFFGRKALPPLVWWQDNMLWRKALVKLLAKRGKPLWCSEYGTGRGPAALAHQVMHDLSTLRPQAWVFWQAVEDAGSSWGLLQVDFRQAAAAAQEQQEQQEGLQQQQQQQLQIVLQPDYFVMQFLVHAVPAGAKFWPLPRKQLGRRVLGVLVWHSQRHWVALLFNASGVEQALALDVSALLPPRAPESGAAAEACAAGAAEVAVSLLAVPELRRVVVTCGGQCVAAAKAATAAQVTRLPPPPRLGAAHAIEVCLPAQHLCRVDVTLLAC